MFQFWSFVCTYPFLCAYGILWHNSFSLRELFVRCIYVISYPMFHYMFILCHVSFVALISLVMRQFYCTFILSCVNLHVSTVLYVWCNMFTYVVIYCSLRLYISIECVTWLMALYSTGIFYIKPIPLCNLLCQLRLYISLWRVCHQSIQNVRLYHFILCVCSYFDIL